MKKISKILLVLLATTLLFPKLLNANEKQTFKFNEFNEFGEIEYVHPINIDGKTNNLYVQFADQEAALQKLIEIEGDILRLISEKYEIEMLDNNNWEKYYYLVEEFFGDEEQEIPSSEYHYFILTNFFDIYENKDKNNEIIKLYNSKTNWEEKSVMLLGLLPYDSPFVEEQTNHSANFNTRAYNRTNAINYAINHATNRAGLSLYYSFANGDCTNFASQILEAGGEPQNNTGNVNSGWWHTVTIGGTMSNPTFTHSHSLSFTTVQKFTAYWGTYYTTTVHSSFASELQAGSVIAGDTNGDGDFNHIGFVTSVGNYNSTLGCVDYMVAQHTPDYHRWVSHSKNYWEFVSKYRIIIH